MYAIIINAIAVLVGSAIGALFKRGISEKYINVLNTAMGLCALALGMNVAIDSMQKTQYPALFIFCLSIGGLLGTVLKWINVWNVLRDASQRVTFLRASQRASYSAVWVRWP